MHHSDLLSDKDTFINLPQLECPISADELLCENDHRIMQGDVGLIQQAQAQQQSPKSVTNFNQHRQGKTNRHP